MHHHRFVWTSFLLLSCGGGTSVETTDVTDASANGGSMGSAGANTSGSGGSASIAGSAGASGSNVVAGSGGTAGANGGSGAAGTSGAGGSAAADGGSCPMPCAFGLKCCGSTCVNPNNDILNCGTCGNKCVAEHPFCAAGKCGVPTCEANIFCLGGGFCCGSMCCMGNQLCCDVPGPVARGVACTPPTEQGTCPVGCLDCRCASPDTPIATPAGNRPIASLRIGDLVYSVDHGALVAVPIEATQRIPARNHVVRRIRLAGGSVLEISAAHPTADGRTFGDLRVGGEIDGIAILDVSAVPYQHEFTYDILPASDTGAYYAGGALIGSTMVDQRALSTASPR